jgi:hypothetical protein
MCHHSLQSTISVFPGGRFIVKNESGPMRLPDVVLKCVTFIGEVTSQESDESLSGDLLATGFFVSVPSARVRGISYQYCVTAKHIAKDLEGREIFAVVNKQGGGVTQLEFFGDHWWLHPTDTTTDLAVIPCVFNRDMDAKSIATEMFATMDLIAARNIGVGDEVFATGLFTPAPGTSRNMPIVRHGNIAMFPEEQIQTELGFADVYLVEARSIGGLSGSPVFVRETIAIKGNIQHDSSPVTISGCGRALLLGLMHGHWDIKESEINKPEIIHDEKRGVNLGIGIVVPARKIIETLNQKELAEMREHQDEVKVKRGVPKMDSARKPNEAESPFTKSDFENALRKVSRKIEPDKKDK